MTSIFAKIKSNLYTWISYCHVDNSVESVDLSAKTMWKWLSTYKHFVDNLKNEKIRE